jgi:hypothetical protein
MFQLEHVAYFILPCMLCMTDFEIMYVAQFNPMTGDSRHGNFSMKIVN